MRMELQKILQELKSKLNLLQNLHKMINNNQDIIQVFQKIKFKIQLRMYYLEDNLIKIDLIEMQDSKDKEEENHKVKKIIIEEVLIYLK